FCIRIMGFVCSQAGTAMLTIFNVDNEQLQVSIPVNIEDPKPQIARFESSGKGPQLRGTQVKLEWDITPPAPCGLYSSSKSDYVFKDPSPKPSGNFETDAGCYRLDVMLADKVVDRRWLNIPTGRHTAVESYSGPQKTVDCDPAEVVGVYNGGEELYAIFRDSDPKKH